MEDPRGCERLGLTIWLRILQVQHVVSTQLEAALSETGLMLTWYEVLIRLRSSGEPLRMQDLADQLLLTQSGATRLVQRIEQAGLAERNPSPEDRRGRVVTLTPKGTRTIDAAIPVFLAAVRDNVTAALSKRDLVAASRVLGTLLEAHDLIPEG